AGRCAKICCWAGHAGGFSGKRRGVGTMCAGDGASSPQYRILVVDDDRLARRLFCEALSKEKRLRVESAQSAAEGIEMIRKADPPYNMLIVDIVMPGMSGCEMTGRVKEMLPAIKVIVTTAYRTEKHIQAALESGADCFIAKPVDLVDLRRSVSRLLELSRFLEKEVDDRDGCQGGVRQPRMSGRLHSVQGEPGQWIEVVGSGDYEMVEKFRRFALELAGSSLNQEDREALQLALEELGQNAVEWGNRKDPSKRLKLSYCLTDDLVAFRIEDEGTGFDVASLPDPSADPQGHIRARKLAGKRLGGFGIFLARKMMDKVEYNAKGNVVTMVKYLRRGGGRTPGRAVPALPDSPGDSV
ncbi:MAG: ATP-binding protein, partial [Planctomycetota bacterium]|nr:ATP-binding protein [Planctomycetota bacterium]